MALLLAIALWAYLLWTWTRWAGSYKPASDGFFHRLRSDTTAVACALATLSYCGLTLLRLRAAVSGPVSPLDASISIGAKLGLLLSAAALFMTQKKGSLRVPAAVTACATGLIWFLLILGGIGQGWR